MSETHSEALSNLLHEERHFDDWASVLFDQALLAEGGQPDDPVRFARRLTELLESAAR